MKLWHYGVFAIILFAALFAAFYLFRTHPGGEPSGIFSSAAWQRMASPGALTKAHAFLEHSCAACHTSVAGVEAANCIVCHATNSALLQRQPTSFHASVSSCKECHREHQGLTGPLTVMDHAALSRIGLVQLSGNPGADTEDRMTSAQLVTWLHQNGRKAGTPATTSALAPHEALLNCATCHSSKDRHMGMLGQDCAQCHNAAAWTIAAYRHPAPSSQDCAQCHQAPPSHYMMHFKMVSMPTAGVTKADVNQCFLCHQTTAWNDIRGVGFFKHH